MGSPKISAWKCCLALSVLRAVYGQVAIETRVKTPAPVAVRPPSNLRIDTSLVLVPVAVCDSKNRPVTGLEKEHFRVFDDSVEQTVTHFAMEDEPVAVGLVFDISGSMANKLRLSRKAVAAFFETANPEDEFFLVEFNEKPKLVMHLTRDFEEIEAQLSFAQPGGRTALMDAIVLGLHELKKSGTSRKALLIVSDGGDNSSRYTRGELRNLVRESDAIIYAMGIYGQAASPEEAAGPGLLTDIAEQTGGRHFPADLRDLPDIAAKIGVELRNRYVIGFSPSNQQRDGRYHPVQVKVNPPHGMPPLRTSWRRGYYAPSE
jgi:Ca-activated chloride channel homolog